MTESLHLDFAGLRGYPASDIDLALISTFSPYRIGMSIWLMLMTSPSADCSSFQMYVPVSSSHTCSRVRDVTMFQSENTAFAVSVVPSAAVFVYVNVSSDTPESLVCRYLYIMSKPITS